MPLSLVDCEERIAAGAVGTSPCRSALGALGIGFATSPSVLSLLESGALFLGEFLELDELEGVVPLRSVPFGVLDVRPPSTSFARFSKANFSRCALDRNLGYKVSSYMNQ